MDLYDFTYVQPVAPAVNRVEQPAFNIDRTFFRKGGSFQFTVKRPEDPGLVLLRTGDEAAVVGFDNLFCGGDVQAEGFILFDPLCSVACLVDCDADHRRRHAGDRSPGSGHVVWLTLDICAHEHGGQDTHVRHRAERYLLHVFLLSGIRFAGDVFKAISAGSESAKGGSAGKKAGLR